MKSSGAASSTLSCSASLSAGDRAQHAVLIGNEFEIDVEGALTPPEQHRCRATCEVDLSRRRCGARQLAHEDTDALGIR